MNGDDAAARSLAEQAATWVPPWARQPERPADPAATAGSDPADASAPASDPADASASASEAEAPDLPADPEPAGESTGVEPAGETADAEPADAEPSDAEANGEALGAEQTIPHPADAEPADADVTDAEATLPTAEAEPADAEPVGTDATREASGAEASEDRTDTESSNAAEAWPAAMEPARETAEVADAEPADAEPADAEPADAEPADAEPADAEPADADAADTEPTGAKAEAEPTEATHAEATGTTAEADGPGEPANLPGALEAILLVVDEPVTEIVLAQVLDVPVERINAALTTLTAEYTEQRRGFDLRRAAGGWRFYTRGDFAVYVERFVLDGQQVRLTQAALETLAVIAYKQPVTRSRISAIRGVNCDGVVRTLMARGLIEECGSEPDSGAFLYRTTTLFLEKLGLDSVDELPPLAPFLPDDVDEIANAQG